MGVGALIVGALRGKFPQDEITHDRRRAFLDQQPTQEWSGGTGWDEYWTNASGLELASYFFPAAQGGRVGGAKPKAVVLLVHSDKVHWRFDWLARVVSCCFFLLFLVVFVFVLG
jgi:hypothetical protein